MGLQIVEKSLLAAVQAHPAHPASPASKNNRKPRPTPALLLPTLPA
jgi:hypothetical protein